LHNLLSHTSITVLSQPDKAHCRLMCLTHGKREKSFPSLHVHIPVASLHATADVDSSVYNFAKLVVCILITHSNTVLLPDNRNKSKQYYVYSNMATIERKSTATLSKSTIPVESLTVTPPVTPNATSTAAHQLVSEIRNIYTVLSELSSLAPSEQVNSQLTRLVNLCVVPYGAEFTAYFFRIPSVESLCSNLRPLCSEAEGELEKFWAKRMLDDLSSKYSNHASCVCFTRSLINTRNNANSSKCSSNVPIPPKLRRSLPPGMLSHRSVPANATVENCFHRLWPITTHLPLFP
jgi:hypothetical protein